MFSLSQGPYTYNRFEESAKPDYLDFDKDGNKKEPMKKALKEKGKKKSDDCECSHSKEEKNLDEGLFSGVKGLFGKNKTSTEKKPESRGEQLRKKYNVGPDKSDTSAKRQILDRTRAKAEKDQKQFGDSTYSKKVADQSKAAHDRYLKAGYSKYGADDRRGSGNKARRRAAMKEEVCSYLMEGGFTNNPVSAEVLFNHMSNDWLEYIQAELENA